MDEAIRKDVEIVKKLINEEELVSEYLILKYKVQKSKELDGLKNQLKYYKKCSMTDEDRDAYLKAKKALESNPLYSNYESAKKEVDNFKEEIKVILEL
ncbi:MAG: YlbF family regulator [Bacilli bacterium]|nr:YlbF family regulator [Bacilli bacterium]